jgi:DNA-binding beta-propeller fold protein YncE
MVDDGLVYCLSYYGTLHAFKNKKLYYSKNLGIRADGDILSFVKSGDDKFFYVLTGEKFYVVDKTWINREKVVGNIPVKNAVSMLVDEKRKSVYVSSQDHFYNISISNRKEPEIMYGLKFKDERLKGTYLLNFSGDKNYFYVLNKTDNTVYKVNIKSRSIVKSKKLFDKKTKKGVNYYSKGKIVYFKAFDKKPEVLFVVKKEATSLSLKGKNGDVYEIYEIVFP